MTSTCTLPSLSANADLDTQLDWLEQALRALAITPAPLPAPLAADTALHDLLPDLLPQRRLELEVCPFLPHQISRDNRYFVDKWQQFTALAGIAPERLEQQWINFEHGLLEVRLEYRGQTLRYPYNLYNFDLEADLHQFCDRFLHEQLYGCASDEEAKVFVLLPPELIEVLRVFRSPHWWRVR